MMPKKKMVSPSVLSADFGNLQRDIEMLNTSSADWIHLDIMDGVFVPNISFGIPVVQTISKYASKPLDVHLMIVQPERYIEAFQKAGANILTVHFEACTHLHRNIQHIKSLGMQAGVSINPHTPVSLLEDIIEDIDLLLIMSVNPGFGGQSFIEKSIDKIKQARGMIKRANSSALIEVDGGINTNNSQLLYEAGADVLVSGNAIFSAPNPIDYINQLKNL